ncbi:MAG: extracellular solute-binding protein [Ruminococcus sp.]|nr:extracellular solute-binding protein [Ruminococcus sp.]
MKKIILITTLLLCCVSCSNQKNTSETENIPDTPKSYTAEKLSDIAYKKEAVGLPDGLNQIYCFNSYNSGNNYFILGAGLTVPEFWTTDRNLQNFEKIEIPDFDIGVSYNMDVAENGTIIEFFADADYGDLPDPDPYSPDYNEAKYDSVAEYSFKINTYSTDGKLLTSVTVGEFPETPDKSTIIEEIVSDGNLLIASVNGTYYTFKTDGSYIGEFTADDGTVEAIGHNRDGSLVCAVSTDDDKLQIRPVNSGGKTEKSSVTYDFSESIQDNITAGTGDYSMFIRSRSTIYGIRSENSAIEPLFSINYSGLGSDNIQGFVMGDDGRFSVIENKYSDFSVKFRTYTQCSREEYESIPHITVGAKYEDYILKEYIDTFNDTHDDMQVDIKLYENDYNGEQANLIGDETFAKDMLDGNLPDVLLMEDTSGNFGSANLYKQGVLCDLYSFIDSDENLSRDSFIPNVMKALEIDDGLYVLPNVFSLEIPYTAKEKFVKDVETWDFNSYMDIVENLPDGMGIEWWENSTDGVYDTKYRRANCYNWANWADFENNTCDFNNDEFIRYLNYCNGAEVIDVEPEYIDPDDWTPPTDEESAYMFKMQQRQFIDDLALFNNAYITGYQSYLYLTQGEFGGEPIRILGEIGNNNTPVILEFGGVNGYSITTTSDKKELAWDFISSMISDEYYKDYKSGNGFFGFPVTKSGLEIKAEFDKQPQSNKYDEGFEDYTGYIYYYGDGDNPSKIGYVDDEIISAVNGLIEKAVLPKKGIYPGEDFYNIAYEEFDRFFNGQTSAEQCAETMQSRLSVYLSENE